MESFTQAYYEMFPENKKEKVWFFLDEIQEVPNWEKFVRRLFDTENCYIYLTGSSSKLLSRELATSLRGRTLPYEVFPLNFKEFLNFNQVDANINTSAGQATILHWFDKWLKQGGYPELVFLPENLHKRTIEESLDLMLFKDLVERFSIKNPSLLKYLLKNVIGNLAQPMSINKTFNDLKSQGYAVAKNTVFDYFSYLEEAFILFKVNIWHRSVRAQAINPSKMYIVDSAFKYSMTIGEDTGRVLENAVFMHLRKKGIHPHYVLNNQEVDFYWSEGIPINVCLDYSNQKTKTREMNGMIKALKFLGLKSGLILTRDKKEIYEEGGKTINIQPAWEYFLSK